LKRASAASKGEHYTASSNVDWIISTSSYLGEPRFTNIEPLVELFSRVEYADRGTFETRLLYLVGPSRYRQAR
jgi:hypothetical protein